MFGCVNKKDVKLATAITIDLAQSLLDTYEINIWSGDAIVYHYEVNGKEYFKEHMQWLIDKIIREDPIEV